ncbi:lysostaphin resistance A-like protein [Salinimicrobium sp. CAU 1759]
MRENQNSLNHLMGGTLLTARITAYLTIFYFFWKKEDAKINWSFKNLKLPVLFSLLIILVGTEFFIRPFLDLLRMFENTSVDFMYSGYSTYGIYSVITALLVAPVLEELFFRKFLFQKLLLKNGFLTGIIISSFLFSLIHWETPLNLIPAFSFGLISAFIYYRTRNVIYCIILHFLYNGVSQLINYKAELYSDWLNWLNFGILYWSLFIFGIIITLFALQRIPFNRSSVTSKK